MQILVSFDTTGSMSPASHEVKRRLTQFVNDIHAVIPDAEIGLIAHGDYNDRYDPRLLPFTQDIAVLKNFLDRAEHTSGHGNGGECYEWVMNIASKVDWTHDKRVFILIGDEPAHGITQYSIRNRTARFDWKTELNNVLARNVTVYQVRCLNDPDSRDYHNQLARIAGTPLLTLAQFNNVVEVLTAISFKEHSIASVETYAAQLNDSHLLNRNLANIIDSLLGKVQTTDYVQFGNTDLQAVDPSRFQVLTVEQTIAIKDFVERLGIPYKKGRGFYELTKMETIQENKEVVLRHKRSGDMFSGSKARELIGLPYGMRGRITKQRGFEYDIFVQSTSVNRKLVPSLFLYET
jgi:hypothetical protein